MPAEADSASARGPATAPAAGRNADRRRVRMTREGPILVEGPVEVELEDGTVVTDDRFLVALCACGRSGRYPFCDTSHRTAPAAGERTGDRRPSGRTG